jgi:hypothetical protein
MVPEGYALHKMSGRGVMKSVHLPPLPDADHTRKMPSRQCSAKYLVGRSKIKASRFDNDR